MMEPSIKPLSLLQNEIVASWIDIPKCFQCNNVFQTTNTVQHYPCRLSCGHTLCNTCLIAIIKNVNDAKCGQCSQRIQHQNPSDWYQLDYDYSLMGFINYQKNIVPHMLQNATNAPTTLQPSTGAAIVSVCVECTKSTKSICVECGMGYCDSCFKKVHSAGVVFKKHQLKDLDTKCSAIGRPLGLCNAHGKKMTSYCQTCSAPICNACVSTSHSMHTLRDLVKVNEKVDLDEPLALLKNVSDVIKEYNKSTVSCIAKLDERATTAAQGIFKTFQTYHTVLQNLEQEAYVELKKRTLAYLQELHTVQNSIEVSGSLIAGTISNIEQFKKAIPKDVDLSAISNKIMTFLETLTIGFDVDQFDDNLFRLDISTYKANCGLKDSCKIKFENTEFYAKMHTFYTARKLSIDAEASSNYPDLSSDSSFRGPKFSPVKSAKLERTLKTPNVQQWKHEPIVSSVKSAKLERTSSLQQSKHELKIKSSEVKIKAITDSMLFHVQDAEFDERAAVLRCNECAMSEKSPSTVVVNEMYLVFENNKDEWYRGVVTEHKQKITLYLVDCGRNVSVTLNQIRQISDYLKAIPPSASRFTICNVEPTGGKWSDECKELILQMALDNNATIIYTEENSGDCIVYSDYPTSIEDTLIYLGYAKSRKILNESENELRRNMIREKLCCEKLKSYKCSICSW